MSSTISDDQVRVYQYAKAQVGKSFTVSELARMAGIRENSAYNHSQRFVDLGILDLVPLHPEQVYSLSKHAPKRSPEMVRRLELALSMVSEQRRKRSAREAEASERMKDGPGAKRGSAKPNGRRKPGKR